MAQTCVVMRPQQEQLFTPGKGPLSAQQDSSLITSTVRKRKVNPTESPHLQPASLQPEDGKRQRTPPVDRGLAYCADGSDAAVRVIVAHQQTGCASAATPAAAVLPTGIEPKDGRQQHPGLGQQAAAQRLPPPQLHEEAAGGADAALFSPQFQLQHKDVSGSAELSASSVSEAVVLDGAAGAVLAVPPAVPVADKLPGAPPPAQQAAQHQEAENISTDHSTGTSASLGDAEVSADVVSIAGCASSLAVASPAPASPPGAPGFQPGCDEEEGEEYCEFDPLLFIKRLPPLERCVPPRRDFLLPKKTRRSKQKTLVLDLDETLVHSTLDEYCRPDFTFPVEVGAMRHMVSVRQRPHLHTFLERVADMYEVVVFTASQRVYAEQLLNIVDPERRLVRHRVYRDSCVLWEGNYLKDLTVLGRDLAHTIIVDNSPQAFGFQLDNGIPIESWYDDDGDDELLKLLPFLERVAQADDVRPHIQKRYCLRSLVEAAGDPAQQQLHPLNQVQQ